MKQIGAVSVLALLLLLATGCGGSRRCSSELILRAVPPRGQQVTPAGMQTERQIIEARLTKLGVSSPSVTVSGGDAIVIRSANIQSFASEVKTATAPGQLLVFDFEPSLVPPTVRGNQQAAPLPSLYDLLKAVQGRASKGTPESYYLFKTSASHHVVQGPAPSLQQLFVTYKGRKQPPNTEVLKVPAGREPVFCSLAQGCPDAGTNRTSQGGKLWYLFKLPPALADKDIIGSSVAADIDPNSGQPIVTLSFTRSGSAAFKRITKAEYDRGRVNAGEAGQLASTNQSLITRYAGHNAIVLDGQLEETPYIDYTDATLALGIIGNAQITEPNQAEARRTALVLQSGSLQYTFEPVAPSGCSR